MSVLGAASFIILWWLSFFVMLPMGVRNHDEAGVETRPGVERAAPAVPSILKKAGYAAILAAVLWAIGFTLLSTGVISLRPAA